MERVFYDARDADDEDKMAEYLEWNADFREREIGEIDEIEPAAEDQAAFDRYMEAQHQLIGVARRMAAAVRDENADGVSTLDGLRETADEQRIKAAIELGTDDCGTVG
jgi:hypothetical protein